MRTREPVSFWRENEIAVAILPRVLASVVVAETSYQVLHVLSFCCDREGDEPPLIKITVLTFKKCKIKLSGLSFFENTRKKVKSPF